MGLSAPPASWGTLQNKPSTVSGFGITDMASQSVSNATNVSNVTTTQVATATASIAFGAIGSYATVLWSSKTNSGNTIAGSTLRKGDSDLGVIASGLSGTWRVLGITLPYADSTAWGPALVLRIA